MDILLVTKNIGKLNEFKRLLHKYNVHFLTLKDLDINDDIVEDGNSFIGNAYIKAKTISVKYNYITLADDSGLCVDSLGGAPGIYSARYAEEHNDKANNNKLLEELKNKEDRSAHFTCALCLYYPNGKYITLEDYAYGTILKSPRGYDGFGYDPLFYSTEGKKTFAEMEGYEKDLYSHRANAIRKLGELVDENFNIKWFS